MHNVIGTCSNMGQRKVNADVVDGGILFCTLWLRVTLVEINFGNSFPGSSFPIFFFSSYRNYKVRKS